MLRQVCKRALAQQLLQQQGPGIAWGCMRQVSEQAKSAVEKTLVVDTLKMVRKQRQLPACTRSCSCSSSGCVSMVHQAYMCLLLYGALMMVQAVVQGGTNRRV
jgi:hypothetical protein